MNVALHHKGLRLSADWRIISSVPDVNSVSHNPPKPPPLVDFQRNRQVPLFFACFLPVRTTQDARLEAARMSAGLHLCAVPHKCRRPPITYRPGMPRSETALGRTSDAQVVRPDGRVCPWTNGERKRAGRRPPQAGVAPIGASSQRPPPSARSVDRCQRLRVLRCPTLTIVVPGSACISSA